MTDKPLYYVSLIHRSFSDYLGYIKLSSGVYSLSFVAGCVSVTHPVYYRIVSVFLSLFSLGGSSGGEIEFTFTSIFVHNLGVSALLLTGSVALGVTTLLVLIFNGLLHGAIIFSGMLAVGPPAIIGTILMHGSLEMPAAMFMSAAGLGLGRRLPDGVSREDIVHAAVLVAVATVMLAVAAWVEVYVSGPIFEETVSDV